MYRNKIKTESQIISSGLDQHINKILTTARREIIIPYQVELQFLEERQARRAMRLIYEYLYFYPFEKSKISLKISGTNLIVKIRQSEESRGRKGLKI